MIKDTERAEFVRRAKILLKNATLAQRTAGRGNEFSTGDILISRMKKKNRSLESSVGDSVPIR